MTVAQARAAWWAWRALPRLRSQLRGGDLTTISLPAAPRSAAALRGVEAVLRRRPNSCLERALLLQCWHAAQGEQVDVVVGVTSPADTFRAHAWLETEPRPSSPEFAELFRLKP